MAFEYFDNHFFHLWGTRASGKTMGAICAMDLYDVKTMVMACPKIAHERLKELGIMRDDLHFISYQQFVEQGCKCDTKFFIDEIDKFLLFLCENYRGHTATTRELE